MSFYSDQAQQFLQMKAAIQTRLTNEGRTLDQQTYNDLCDRRDTLGDQADVMLTDDVQAALAQLKVDQQTLADCTAALNDAVKKIKKFDDTLAIVSAAVCLATAIAKADPEAIGEALLKAKDAIDAAVAKPSARGESAAKSDGLPIAANAE